MKKELCEQLVLECEQAIQKMGGDLYEVMKKAPLVVERWRPFFLTAEHVWNNACNREDAIRYLLSAPDPNPEEFEKALTFLRSLPYFLRGWLQEAAKGLPPSPGGRPHGLEPPERREVRQQIGRLYAEGVSLSDAKKRMAQSYGVSLSTIQRAWQERIKPSTVSSDIKKSEA
jgi:hypothetical protein